MMPLTESFNPPKHTPLYEKEQNEIEKLQWNLFKNSQVSLWGGDAMFSNLDLRLDVLERELGLPFSFVSGHIHELHIHVPWTRLHAEPIVITINTIGRVNFWLLLSILLGALTKYS